MEKFWIYIAVVLVVCIIGFYIVLSKRQSYYNFDKNLKVGDLADHFIDEERQTYKVIELSEIFCEIEHLITKEKMRVGRYLLHPTRGYSYCK